MSYESRVRSQRDRGVGVLVRHVVTHGEKLDPKELSAARALCSSADFALVVGSSLRVRPFSDFPLLAVKMGLINLGVTTAIHESLATQNGIRVWDRCDIAMRALMKAIYGPAYEIPSFEADPQKRHKIFDRASALGHGNASVRLLSKLK